MQLKLTYDDIAQLNAIIGELPHKYAVGLVAFFNHKVHEQERMAAVSEEPEEEVVDGSGHKKMATSEPDIRGV